MLTATKRALLLGCGHDRRRKIRSPDEAVFFADDSELTTLDMSPDVGADVVWDLERLPLPFEDESFDEAAAYDVLEHIGQQGNWRGWFDLMSEIHRVLAPGGTFSAIVPTGQLSLCDPGHTRFFHANYFGFLTKEFYERNREKGTAATDYRWYIKRWWTLEVVNQENPDILAVVLRKA